MGHRFSVMEFDDCVQSSAEVCGSRFSGTLDGGVIRIFMPTRVHEIGRLSAPRADVQYRSQPEPSVGFEGHVWGYSNSRDSVAIRSVIVELVDSVPQVVVLRTLRDWGVNVVSWLRSFAEGSTDFQRFKTPVYVYPTHGQLEPTDTEFSFPQRASEWDWEHAVHHASRDENPPLAASLLASANEKLQTGQTREAVFIASIAAERAVSSAFARFFADGDDRFSPSTTAPKKMFGQRLQHLEVCGVLTDSEAKAVRDNLSQPRNMVAHEGKLPDFETARRACGIAALLVERFEPPDSNCSSWCKVDPHGAGFEPLTDGYWNGGWSP
jgi:hypothetical protein